MTTSFKPAAVTSDTAEPIDWPRADVFPDGGLAYAGPEAVVVVGGYRGSPSPSIAIFELHPAES